MILLPNILISQTQRISVSYSGVAATLHDGCETLSVTPNMRRVVRKPFYAYAKTKTQISFAVTAKLISAFVFATKIEQSLFFLNPKFQASSNLLWLYIPVCVGPGRKPRRPVFSQRGSYMYKYLIYTFQGPRLF